MGAGGDSQCGSRCQAACAAPAGSQVTVLCSTTIQARCTAPPGTGGSPTADAPGAGGAAADSTGGSGGGSATSYALENPISGANTIPDIIGKGVKTLMGIVGAIALLMFVYGGIRWILAAGEPKAVTEASEILKNATIGLAIIFLSYTIITVGMGLVNQLSQQGSPDPVSSTNAPSSGTPAPINRTVPAGGGAPAGRDTSGAQGTCVISPSIPVDIIRGAASPEQLRQAETSCTSVHGTFNSTALTCTGPATEEECTRVKNEINRAAPITIVGSTWTR